MTIRAEVRAPGARRRFLTLVTGIVLGGGLIVAGAILPAEFGRDPLGIGRLTGISELWRPAEIRYVADGVAAPSHDYPGTFRSDTIMIPIADFESGKAYELEYKVRMRRGATLIYSWAVSGAAIPEDFYSEFHGHTVEAGKTMTVADYRKANGLAAHGALVAPFDGVHGWYFQNSAAGPVVVRLRLSGYYDLIPPGEVGNEAGIVAGSASPISR